MLWCKLLWLLLSCSPHSFFSVFHVDEVTSQSSGQRSRVNGIRGIRPNIFHSARHSSRSLTMLGGGAVLCRRHGRANIPLRRCALDHHTRSDAVLFLQPAKWTRPESSGRKALQR